MSVSLRYKRTAQQFQRWLMAHPNADAKRQVGAFDSIADTEFYESKIKKRAPVKAVRSKA